MRGVTRANSLALLAVLVAPPVVASAAPQELTFARDVAPILYENCVECHRPGSFAPMSLLTYENARLYAPLMKARVQTRQMPPWHVDQTVGIQDYANDASLTDEEIALFSRLGTIDMRVDFLRPGLGEVFFATGLVLRVGRKVAVTRMELHNDEGSLIAVATGAYSTGAYTVS